MLLRTELVAGHGGRSGRYDAWKQIAWEWAFVLDQVGAQLSRRRAQKSTRITTRRSVGRLTSVNPASANTLSVPTRSSSRITFFVVMG